MTEIVIKLIATCLWCEKEIPFSENIKGRLFCSVKCMEECNKHGGQYEKSEVIRKGTKQSKRRG